VIEPPLQPLTREIIEPKNANFQGHDRGFWGYKCQKNAFFDISLHLVFHPNALSYCNTSVPPCIDIMRHRRSVSKVTMSGRLSIGLIPTLLMFATTGSMGKEAIVFIVIWLTFCFVAA